MSLSHDIRLWNDLSNRQITAGFEELSCPTLPWQHRTTHFHGREFRTKEEIKFTVSTVRLFYVLFSSINFEYIEHLFSIWWGFHTRKSLLLPIWSNIKFNRDIVSINYLTCKETQCKENSFSHWFWEGGLSFCVWWFTSSKIFFPSWSFNSSCSYLFSNTCGYFLKRGLLTVLEQLRKQQKVNLVRWQVVENYGWVVSRGPGSDVGQVLSFVKIV